MKRVFKLAFTEKLYKTDSKGKTRVWFIEYTDTAYRTHSGVFNGKLVISGWQYPEQKNVGKANETSVSEQVLSEVTALVEKRSYQGKYHAELDDISKGAKFLEPMLAQKYDPKKFPIPVAGYLSQPKLDGVRCLVLRSGEMQSRQGKPILSAPHVAFQLHEWFETHPEVVALDGELYNHELKHDFERIISLARKTKPTGDDLALSAEQLQFHVYDVITETPLPYFGTQGGVSRVSIIDEIEGKFFSVKTVPSTLLFTEEELESKLAEYIEAGYEGQMLRDRTAPYEHRRSKSLLKHKTFVDEEVEILELLEGQGNWSGVAKAAVIKRSTGVVQQSGMRGSFDYAAYLLENKDSYVNTKATCRAMGETVDGKLRFPVITYFWGGERDL